LSWNEVPGAEEYTIYYTTNGTFPTKTYGNKIENITDSYSPDNPFVIDELENGYLHVFMLEAKTGDGSKSWLSNYEMAIPISRLSLVPILKAGYGEIEVYWTDIPATNDCELLRAESKDGDYLSLFGTITGNYVTDTSVETGKTYYYMVKTSY